MTYKQLGYSVIGMTNMPEAKLAREAEICYATVAMVTDFDCWHPDHDAVTVQDIIKVLQANAEKAKRLVARLARDFPREHEPCPIGSDRALDTALITAPEARDPELIKKLDAVAGRVLVGADGSLLYAADVVGQTAEHAEESDAHRRSAAAVQRRMAAGVMTRMKASPRTVPPSSACSSNGASRDMGRRSICTRSRRCCASVRGRPTSGSMTSMSR